MTKTSEKQAKQDTAIETLRNMLHPEDNVYIVVTRVARSGMSRQMLVLVSDTTHGGGKIILNISGNVADALDLHWNDNDTMRVPGCGMDMGAWVVRTLAAKVGFDLTYRLL